MRLAPIGGLLKNLNQEIPACMRREYLSREDAYEKLKALTGEDFGMDVERWAVWIAEQETMGRVFRIPNPKASD